MTWAVIMKGMRCEACGWEVVDIGVNPPLFDLQPYMGEDYWAYCSNPVCKNHDGEGYLQSYPEWVVSVFHEG